MKKESSGNILPRMIIALGTCICTVAVSLTFGIDKIYDGTPRSMLLSVAIILLIMLGAQFIHTVIHEFGHLVFGLLSGYRFISFRIGRFMFIKHDGRLKAKIYNIVGTGGQCLMMPPEWSENLPTRLYNFGGCIANLLISALSIVLLLVFALPDIAAAVFVALAVLGITNAAINGIPFKFGGISNDGYNAFLLSKDKISLRAFWLQLYVNGLMANGKRLGEMPEEWFFIPEGEYRNDPVVCTVGVLRFNHFFDLHEFEKAEEIAVTMLGMPGLLGVHRNELLCELVFLRIFRGAPSNEIDPMLTGKLRGYIRATSSYVSRKRLDFAYQLLYKRNPVLAEKCLSDFEKIVKTYPYETEIANEKEVIEMIKEKA